MSSKLANQFEKRGMDVKVYDKIIDRTENDSDYDSDDSLSREEILSEMIETLRQQDPLSPNINQYDTMNVDIYDVISATESEYHNIMTKVATI